MGDSLPLCVLGVLASGFAGASPVRTDSAEKPLATPWALSKTRVLVRFPWVPKRNQELSSRCWGGYFVFRCLDEVKFEGSNSLRNSSFASGLSYYSLKLAILLEKGLSKVVFSPKNNHIHRYIKRLPWSAPALVDH